MTVIQNEDEKNKEVYVTHVRARTRNKDKVTHRSQNCNTGKRNWNLASFLNEDVRSKMAEMVSLKKCPLELWPISCFNSVILALGKNVLQIIPDGIWISIEFIDYFIFEYFNMLHCLVYSCLHSCSSLKMYNFICRMFHILVNFALLYFIKFYYLTFLY